MVKVILHGSNGKMGQVISGLLEENQEMEVVAGIGRQKIGSEKYPVYDHLRACSEIADVVIDFSNVEAAEELFEVCVERKLPLVIGTTGYSDVQMRRMEVVSRSIPVFYSANMSRGIQMLKCALEAVSKELVKAGFDIEILEKHHNQKQDAPSGTALVLAEVINETMENHFTYQYNRNKKKREQDEIGIVSLRGGTIPGDHEVIFAGMEEVLSFQHRAYSKKIFGKGALEAAKFLVGNKAGLYSMKDIM